MRKNREQKEAFVIIAIFLVVFVGIVVVVFMFPSPHMPSPFYENMVHNEAGVYLADDYKYGTNPNASVHVVVFGDYQCPYTAKSVPVINQMLEAYGNKINFVYKHMPNFEIHEQALLASLAAECAGEQDMFWEYSQQLFNQYNNLSYDVFVNTARVLGLDVIQFYGCMSTKKYAEKIKDDLGDVLALKLTGTPTIFINNMMFQGVYDFEDYSNHIKEGLFK